MICSKVLTLGKVNLVERLAQCHDALNISDLTEYFNLGYPILDPPTLRGSMAALFHPEFIKKNRDSITFGSPVDTGGLAFGLFEGVDDPHKLIADCKCNSEKFVDLLTVLHNSLDSNEIQCLYQHQLSGKVLKILQRFFSARVINLIIQNKKNPHSLLFEFSMSSTYTMSVEDVEKLFVPNTLDSQRLFPNLNSVINKKIFYFNPKYGIEHAIIPK